MSVPISCELTPEAVRSSRSRLLPSLVQRAERREGTPDGYRLTFPAAESIQQIAEVIEAERHCCRWLVFRLDVPSGGGAVVLTLSGPEGGSEFLSALFEL